MGSSPTARLPRSTGWAIYQPTATSSRCPSVDRRGGGTSVFTQDRSAKASGLRCEGCPSRALHELRLISYTTTRIRKLSHESLRTSLRGIFDYAGAFADSLAPHAARFGLRRGDGNALLRWLLELSDDPDVHKWLEEAETHDGKTTGLRKAITAS